MGLTQLLDESTEILMLVTNSIKNDINNPNQFISGTALCALGNIGNQEMCMALSREVQMQLSVDNPMIRKKAALCAMRIIKKVDDIPVHIKNLIISNWNGFTEIDQFNISAAISESIKDYDITHVKVAMIVARVGHVEFRSDDLVNYAD